MCKQTANTRWCESLPGQGDCFTSVICMKMSTRFPLGQPATAYDQSQGNATFVEYLLPVQCKQRFFLGQQIPFNLRRTYNLNKIFVLHDNMSISISECVSVCVHLCVCVRACVRACLRARACVCSAMHMRWSIFLTYFLKHSSILPCPMCSAAPRPFRY